MGILKLVDEDLLSLETRAADILDFWTAEDYRKEVTVRHLLSFTAGMSTFPGGLASCSSGGSTRACAIEAYNECFRSGAAPGTEFDYTESSWYVVSAMALEVTGLPTWDDVFFRYIALPLGIDPSRCTFGIPNRNWAYAGGGLSCDTLEYSKVLQAILGKTLLRNTTLFDEAERPHTLDVRRSPTLPWPTCSNETQALGCKADMMPLWPATMSENPKFDHYGLGQWIECSNPTCDGGILRTSSGGGMGTYPWIERGALTGNPPHFGVVVRLWPPSYESWDVIHREVLPLAAAVVEHGVAILTNQSTHKFLRRGRLSVEQEIATK